MKAAVLGAGGFIGHHLVKYLKDKGYYVYGIDIKHPEFEKTSADLFLIRNLCRPFDELNLDRIFPQNIDEVYHLAANMGGISWIENHKAEIVYDNTMINMNVLKVCQEQKVGKLLFTSSACVYPGYLQKNTQVSELKEEDAYPADAEDGYGWEKLMMERACRHFREDYGLKTYIARFHNIYGPLGTYEGGREKSPAALCRKMALAKPGDTIEIWGDGTQTRSYCYIDDCVEAIYRLMQSDYHDPLNIGTDRLVSIAELARIIQTIAGKNVFYSYDTTKPQGVRGRNADITKAKLLLGWQPKVELEDGIERTYNWISQQLKNE